MSLILEWKTITLKDTCSGEVIIKDKDGMKTVAAEGFSVEKGRKLCQRLKCGEIDKWWSKNTSNPIPTYSFNCTNIKNQESIWGCIKQHPPIQKEQLVIKCKGTFDF